MPMESSEIEALIKESFPDAHVEIEDLRGDGDHYAATVISAAFAGKTKVRQHQMVYAALKGRMGQNFMRWLYKHLRLATIRKII